MKDYVSKTNQSVEFFNQRLDEIHMNGHERLKAKARFAQAEAVADALALAVHWIGRQLKRLAAKPAGRTAPSIG